MENNNIDSADTEQTAGDGGAGVPQPPQRAAGSGLVVLTGMSGAGRTESLHILEDLGYFCIDNLPPNMLLPLSELAGMPGSSETRLAVVCDVRSRGFFRELRGELRKLDERGVGYQVVFLDADDASLRNRYSSLRRRHPLAREAGTLSEAISLERQQLVSVHELASLVIDTSDMRTADLRALLCERFSEGSLQRRMNVSVFSFGFKYGLPRDADLVVDVRFLPNPYYDPAMRELTGHDAPVREFVLGKAETVRFLDAWYRLLDVTMPGYVAEGKQHLTVALGCTGGQHRSVVVAEETAAHLNAGGYNVSVSHRDIARHGRSRGGDRA